MQEPAEESIVRSVRLVGWGLLAALLVVVPVFNPYFARAASGRAYASQVIIFGIVLAGFVIRLLERQWRHVALLAGLSGAFVVSQFIAADYASATNRVMWAVRPLQPMLLAVAIVALIPRAKVFQWVMVAVGGAALGMLLAYIGWLAPSIDITKITRPDLGWIPAVGRVPREIGGFVYPNNLGTYAAYASVAGLWLVLSRRERWPQWLGGATVALGVVSIAATGNRAAAGGWVFGTLFVLVAYLRSHPAGERQWPAWVTLGGTGVVTAASLGLVLLTVPFARVSLKSNPQLERHADLGFAEERIITAAGSSFDVRWQDWKAAMKGFEHHAVLGSGMVDKRTDNLYVMYVGAAGVLGVLLLVLLAWKCWFAVPRRGTPAQGWERASTLRTALLLVGGASGLLQDSLGQLAASWFPGVMIGLALAYEMRTPTDPVDDAVPVSASTAASPLS